MEKCGDSALSPTYIPNAAPPLHLLSQYSLLLKVTITQATEMASETILASCFTPKPSIHFLYQEMIVPSNNK